MAILLLRTLILYTLLLVTMRFMGKRQAGQLEISELAVTFMLSELAVLPISDTEIPLSHAVLPMGLLLIFEIILSFIISKSALFKKLLVGKPSVIIRKGQLDKKELASLRMSFSELMGEMRLKGVSSIAEVEYAIVEDNGQLSVFKKERFSPITGDSLNGTVCEKGIAHCIIIEGNVYKHNLKLSGKDESWLQKELANRHLTMDQIFLMTVDDSGDVFIIM